jgi:hypothetical protein
MTDIDIFEQATRQKVCFEYKGLISVDDLWDLSLESLDALYKKLMTSSKSSKEDGLLKTKNAEDKLSDLKIALVKRVFEVKQEEDAKRKVLAENRRKKEYLKTVLEQKQNEAVLAMPMEKIQELIDGLE